MEFKILPLTADIGSVTSLGTSSLETGLGATSGTKFTPEQLARPFLYLLIAQGIFAGLTIGKLAEGSVKAGLKHSFILAVAAFLIATGVRVFFGA